MADHHPLDVWPLPREQKPVFINEPWLIDESIYFESAKQMMAAREPENEGDKRNESNVYMEVCSILAQIEIYDQLWFVREGMIKNDENGMICGHSQHATEVVKEIIKRLEAVDTCEDFLYDVLDELKKVYEL